MKSLFVFLTASIVSLNAQNQFKVQQTEETNLQESDPNDLTPEYIKMIFGLSHLKNITEGAFQGRAETFDGTQWKTICSKNFNLTDADAFCKQFNPRFGAVSWSNVGDLPYTRQLDFSDGNQKSIFMNDVKKCNHSQDVVVTCSRAHNYTSNGYYRLANPKNITQRSGAQQGVWGRLEYFSESSGNIWRQTCRFTQKSAQVLCKTLNLPFADAQYKNVRDVEQYYGNGLALTGPDYNSIYQDCNGRESSLDSCNYYNLYNCSHQNDVIVFCQN